MKKTAGIRFDDEMYVNIAIEDGAISLYTIDKDGNVNDYEVSPKTRTKKTKKEA